MSYKHILVAVDLTPSSEKIVNKAISLAKYENSKLSLVYVKEHSVILEPKDRLVLESKLEDLVEKTDYPIHTSSIVVGDLHIKLSGMVKESDIDLVVCGHHHKLLSRVMSSVPKVADAVEADLLVVYLDD